MANVTIVARHENKNDSAINWSQNNPVLLKGELGIESDTGKYKIGDGVTTWNSLNYYEKFTTAEKNTVDNIKPVATSGAGADLTVDIEGITATNAEDAIAEVQENVNSLTDSLVAVATTGSAADVTIDVDGITADNVQDAIVEVASQIGAVPSYNIQKLVTAETGYTASYQLLQGETPIGDKINIPKDYLVKSCSVEEVETVNVPVSGYTVGQKYIDFVINTSDETGNESHIYLLIDELVDVYTGGNGINVSDSNVVSVKIDTENANGLAATAAGLKLNPATTSTSGAMTAVQVTKLEGLENYTHPTTAGNKHIPSGGATGQFLKYAGSDGTAEWGDIPEYTIATGEEAGIVKSTDTENGVSVAVDGTMSVNSINVSKLIVSDSDTLIFDSGDSTN